MVSSVFLKVEKPLSTLGPPSYTQTLDLSLGIYSVCTNVVNSPFFCLSILHVSCWYCRAKSIPSCLAGIWQAFQVLYLMAKGHCGTLCDLIKFISVIWSKCNTPVSTELIQFHFCILLPLYHSMHIL